MATGGIGVTSRRDQLTIMSDLLEIIGQPQRLTHILYKSNMSYGQLSKYLDELTELEFIEIRAEPFRSFIITPKGKQFNDMLSLKKRSPDLEA
jgi:predicted transcriptional regulator